MPQHSDGHPSALLRSRQRASPLGSNQDAGRSRRPQRIYRSCDPAVGRSRSSWAGFADRQTSSGCTCRCHTGDAPSCRRCSSNAVSSAHRANQASTTSSRNGSCGKLFSATRLSNTATGAEPHGPQQQGVVGVDHRHVGRRRMRAPVRPEVERVQRVRAGRQVPETADPDEPVGVVQIAELTDDVHPGPLLAVDQVGVEDVDQIVPLSGVQGVLAQVDHGATLVHECEQTIET